MNREIVLRKDKPADRDQACRFLQRLAPDKAWRVEVTPYKPRRSDPQNRALWGHAYKVLGRFMGMRGRDDMELLHESMCRLYFGEYQIDVLGKIATRPKRTTTTNEHGDRSPLTIPEFQDFFAFVQQKGAELGCYIEDPDPEWFMHEDKPA